MTIEQVRRKWVIVASTALLTWGFVIAGIVALVESDDITVQAIVSLLLAAIAVIIGLYAGRALMKFATPTGRSAALFGLVLYGFYLYILLILAVGIAPWLIEIPDLSTFPAESMLKVAGAGTTILGIVLLVTFAMWHRAYLQEIKSFSGRLAG